MKYLFGGLGLAVCSVVGPGGSVSGAGLGDEFGLDLAGPASMRFGAEHDVEIVDVDVFGSQNVGLVGLGLAAAAAVALQNVSDDGSGLLAGFSVDSDDGFVGGFDGAFPDNSFVGGFDSAADNDGGLVGDVWSSGGFDPFQNPPIGAVSGVDLLDRSDWSSGGFGDISTGKQPSVYLAEGVDSDTKSSSSSRGADVKSGEVSAGAGRVDLSDVGFEGKVVEWGSRESVETFLELTGRDGRVIEVADSAFLSQVFSDLEARLSEYPEGHLLGDVAANLPPRVARLDNLRSAAFYSRDAKAVFFKEVLAEAEYPALTAHETVHALDPYDRESVVDDLELLHINRLEEASAHIVDQIVGVTLGQRSHVQRTYEGYDDPDQFHYDMALSRIALSSYQQFPSVVEVVEAVEAAIALHRYFLDDGVVRTLDSRDGYLKPSVEEAKALSGSFLNDSSKFTEPSVGPGDDNASTSLLQGALLRLNLASYVTSQLDSE